MASAQPIGVFDSGIGGTSIWKEIHQLLPHENTVYLADSANAPYGLRSKEEIVALSRKNTDLLLEMGAKIIVVACNTATTNAIRELRASYDVPFIGIEPAIKPAALRSETHTVGILATKGTLASELFHKKLESYTNVEIIEQIGHGLVELIENGAIDAPEMDRLLRSYLTPMLEAGIDYLVLGCSHYPYLVPQLRKILPPEVHIIDSGEAVARQTRLVLEQHNALNTSTEPPYNRFYSNADPKVLQGILGGDFSVERKSF